MTTSSYPYLTRPWSGFAATAGAAHSLLIVTGHERIAAVNSAGICLINLVLNAALIPVMGVMGAAVATATSYLVATTWSVLIVRARLKINSFIIPIPIRRSPNAGDG